MNERLKGKVEEYTDKKLAEEIRYISNGPYIELLRNEAIARILMKEI